MAHQTPTRATSLHAVLIITRLDVGGAQETVLALADGLPRHGVRVTVLAGPEMEAGGAIYDELRAVGAQLHVVEELRSAIRPSADLLALREVARLLRTSAPDIVHTHSSKAGVIGRMAARRAGVPVVVHTVHGWSFHDAQPRWVQASFRRIERWLAKRSDALIVVSGADRTTGVAAGIGRSSQYHLVRSGIALAPAVARAPNDVATGGATVLFVGRLAEQKDPLLVIDAFDLLARRLPEVTLRMIGDGPLRPAVEERIAALGLRNRVDLVGVVRDVRPRYREAGVFVLASRWEGLPRTVLEAVAEGVPVVTNDVGGVAEMIEHEATGLVHDRTPESIADALHRVLVDRPLADRLVASARERLEPFDVEAMVVTTASLYRELTR